MAKPCIDDRNPGTKPGRVSTRMVELLRNPSACHWLSQELSEAKRDRLAEKASHGAELVMVQPLNAEWTCHRYGGTGDLLVMEPPGRACTLGLRSSPPHRFMRLMRLQSLQVSDGGTILPKRLRACIARSRKFSLCRDRVLDLEVSYSTVIVSLAGLICILSQGQSCGRGDSTKKQLFNRLWPILRSAFIERSG